MKNNESKTCYVINFWLGDRRRTVSKNDEDRLYFLKKQIEVLQSIRHNLNKIIFTFNIESEHYHYLSDVFKLIPKSIQGADCEINIRENYGISYGAWSDIFTKYKSEYDYYIFTEDDYFFIEHNWDDYLVKKHNSYEDCGYLCMMVREPHSWNGYRKIAGSSVGIASSETLMQIYKKFGKLPSLNKADNNDNVYKSGHDIQNQFGFSFLEIGKNIYDIRDDYKIIFSKGEPPGFNEHIDVWLFFNWNSNYLNVSAEYFNGSFSYYDCYDLEFQSHYNMTSKDEALYCYNKEEIYYDEDENGMWIRKKYPQF